ncbi:class I SAM-dependent methyltransferase [Actinophytocola sp.]|uniref:class I SAM-dependent methyltransferase n=1 Tax=Actinophytocola sp. TaxID=1872138 RepID=UPI002D7F1412|nr:class I SAM-dependent methyltransferase [Actinophytocola sp.]HET9140041.1 class I SAM-dependent methyltransferase [Actinophytocola sp.]
MTAHLYWDRMWGTDEGRGDWSKPHPWVTQTVEPLRRQGVRDVLDVGCGVGRHALFLAEQGFRVRGTDRSETAAAFVRAEAARRGLAITMDIADFTALPYPADSVDFVLAFNVVYHADEQGLGRALAEIGRVLRPGGCYQSTMLSKRNAQYGRGIEISPNTFVQPEAADDKVHPHLYADAGDLVRLHRGFQLLSAFDGEQTASGSFHWHCLFQLGATATPVPLLRPDLGE